MNVSLQNVRIFCKVVKVNPKSINRSLFKKARALSNQETMRKLINEAFEMLDKYQEKYGKSFIAMIPDKKWDYKSVLELKNLANEFGDKIADWVEQALIWAQQIDNGETWEAVCDYTDIIELHRLVVWKDGYVRLVGGKSDKLKLNSASDVSNVGYDDRDRVYNAVPLIISYIGCIQCS